MISKVKNRVTLLAYIIDKGRFKIGQLVKVVNGKITPAGVKFIKSLTRRKQKRIKRLKQQKASVQLRNSLTVQKVSPFRSLGLTLMPNEYICFGPNTCGSHCSNKCPVGGQPPRAFRDKRRLVAVKVDNDPWEDLQPDTTDLDEIQPDSLGQCVLTDMDVLIVLKTSGATAKQWKKLKTLVEALWFLLSGQDNNVHNSESKVTLLLGMVFTYSRYLIFIQSDPKSNSFKPNLFASSKMLGRRQLAPNYHSLKMFFLSLTRAVNFATLLLLVSTLTFQHGSTL